MGPCMESILLRAEKESADIDDKAKSLALYLQNLDRTFKETRGQGIVLELSSALKKPLCDGEGDDAQLLRTLYSIAHFMDSQGLFESALPYEGLQVKSRMLFL